MRPEPTPEHWVDRKQLFLDNLDRMAPLEQSLSWEDDDRIAASLKNLTVVGFDPGGTTGWSVMKVDYAKLMDLKLPVQDAVHAWYHGQVDCGSQSGSAGDSATANDYDLGISETGEAAGAAICVNIIELQFKVYAGLGTAVVIEDFIPREQNMSRDFLSPVRVTSRIEQKLWELRAVTQWRQQPSEAKTAITDDRLKNWGLYRDGQAARHARDADRHALLFLRKARQKPGRIRDAWPVVALAKERGLL